ncbi:hypothetical protein Tco_1029768 [Tanacetum coccineum]|uniref:Uncharacterized protein n=1 Tax=Tanacetum coccineum TaxID=301880 RepID=A0ABQ5G657_9ASTR
MSEAEPIPPQPRPVLHYVKSHLNKKGHLLSFHDATNAKTIWTAIKARFSGNEASKKMQKNLLKQQFETFTIGSREELDSAYERFQNILSMLELYDAKVSLEDANLKFLRSLPSVWHVVATMIAADNLDWGDEIICSFFAQQTSMPTTHDDEDLLQIDEDAMEEIDIRWQVAMITARIRKFMRKNSGSLMARECRFARINPMKTSKRRQVKRNVSIEESNSKALVATDNNERYNRSLMQNKCTLDKIGLGEFD